MKQLAVVLLGTLAACGGSQQKSSPPAPTADLTPVAPAAGSGSTSRPLDDINLRKHAFTRLPNELPWNGSTALVGADGRLQKIQAGAAFDITDGPAVVVTGTVTNEKAQPVVYWNQHAHKLQCGRDADCVIYVHKDAKADSKDILASDIQWTQLDPARPDPLVFPLWGDGTKEPNGFLMKMKAGGGPFWHVHRNDYQGVVLAGNVVSYESGTQPREMPPGSFWWQPRGMKHTTDCRGPSDCVVLLDFTGPFDVKAVQ